MTQTPETAAGEAGHGAQVATALAELFGHPVRTPIVRTPADYGLAFEDVQITTADGVVLQGWFIPADSDRLVIANHPMPCNRYGFPGHLEPFNQMVDFEVNFLPDYQHLHEAGYNVLAYDLRNHGESASGSDGVMRLGLEEYQDVVASLRWGRERLRIDNSHIGLLSRCLGANSTIVGLSKEPAEFEGLGALIAVQPASVRPIITSNLAAQGVPEAVADFDRAFGAMTGHALDEMSPTEYAKDVAVPTLVVQVHADSSTTPADVQGIFDNLASTDKDLHWIEGTTRRFDGYNYLPEHPEVMLEWFDSRVG